MDGVLSISHSLKDLARAHANSNCVIETIPIMVDYDRFKLPDLSSKSEIPYIFHSGTLYEQKDGILVMIEAYGIALQRSICTGNKERSPHAKEIQLLIDKYNLEGKLIFTGYLETDKLQEYLSHAALVIINKYKTQQNHYCFSTKLGEYLAAGKPIIITNVGEAMNYLKDRDSAYVIEPGDTNMLANTIVELLQNPKERKRIDENGRQVCKSFFDYRSHVDFL